MINSRPGQWYFECWSSLPTCQLPGIYQSPQIASPCITSWTYSYIQWERECRVLTSSYLELKIGHAYIILKNETG